MTSSETIVKISSDLLSVEISPVGAELMSITDQEGRTYLHDGASFWTGRAPLLFPIVGAIKDDRYEADGQTYTLPKHGFARKSKFTLLHHGAGSATLRLEQTAETLAQWPWHFRLDVTHALHGALLTTTVQVTNTDVNSMPVAFGFHPAFAWPLPGAGARDEQVIEFALEEPAPVTRIDIPSGLVAREMATPVKGRLLELDDSLFDEDALLFLEPKSRSLRFGPASGKGTSLLVHYDRLPHLGIWTKPGGAPFLCIEPWHGHASPMDFAGSLKEKPGSLELMPTETHVFEMSAELVWDQ